MMPMFSSALLRTQSDERLVVLAREGQERAFEAIVDRYRKPLQRYCERALPRSRAEDVVQQVLLNAWLALRNGTDVQSLRAWLYRIARNTVLETAQAPGYDYGELRQSLHGSDEPESEFAQRAVIRKTLTGLAALPEAQREALLRDAFAGQSRAQIAEALGVSEGAVRQLLYRARVSLRTAATVVTPFPLANWLATIGQGSVAGTGIESGAAGSIGLVGVAKAGTILASAGVLAVGPTGVRDGSVAGAKKAEAGRAKVTHKRPQVTRPAPIVVRSRPSAAQGEVGQSRQHEGSGQEGEQRDSQSAENRQGERTRSRDEGDDNRRDVQQPDGANGGQSETSDASESDSGD